MKERYWVDYDNDTGPDDDYYIQWWTVIDEESGATICKCDEEADAQHIAQLLNVYGGAAT